MLTRGNMKVTVNTDELVRRLKKNKREHVKQYDESLKLWQNDLAFALREINADDYVGFPKSLKELERDCPTSHEDEYERVIDMFTMCTSKTIELDQEMFNTYCRDEWDWKHSVFSNKYYSMTVSA